MKKKILLIIALILLLVPAFIFLVPVKDGRTFYKIIKYNRLLAGAVQPDNYDKMKVSYVNIVGRKTGTSPFDSVSDMDGHDASDEDDYVRTADVVKYTIEVGVALNLDHSEVTETTSLTGGVIKVKATIPEVDGETYFSWIKDTWMKNVSYSNNGRTIYAEYQVPATETIVGGNQQLSFQIISLPYKKELSANQTPIFEVWMEGNEPDNELSVVESKTCQDNRILFITGKDSYEINVNNSSTPPLSISADKDGQKGQYFNIGISGKINPIIDNNNYSGTLFPVRGEYNNAIIEVKLKYSYKDASTANGRYIPVEAENLNGLELIAYNKEFEDNPNAYPNETSNRIGTTSYNEREMKSTYAGMEIGQNYGNMVASIDGDILKIKIKDFYSTYFRSPTAASKTFFYSRRMFANAFEFFMPFYEPVINTPYDYKFEYEIVSAKLVDDEDNEVFDILSTDTQTSNNKQTYYFRNYLSGNVTTSLYSDIKFDYSDENKDEDAFTYQGAVNKISSSLYVSDGPYLGGEERLFTFDASKLNLVQKDGKWYEFQETNTLSLTSDTPEDNQEIKYGIYKLNNEQGLTSLALVNSALKDDFDWYNTPEEANEHGKITAIYWNNPDYDGMQKKDIISFYVSAVDTHRDDKTVTSLRQKVWVYGDENRTEVYEKYTSTDENYFTPSSYGDGYLKLSQGTPYQAGEGILIMKGYAVLDLSGMPIDEQGKNKKIFNVQDEKVKLKLRLSTEKIYGEIEETDTAYYRIHYPFKYLTLIPESCTIPPLSDELSSENYSELTWKLENFNYSDLPFTSTCYFSINPFTPNNLNTRFSIYVEPYTEKYNYKNGSEAVNAQVFDIINLAGSSTRKLLSRDLIDSSESFTVEGQVYNISDSILTNVKTIEFLPKNNDSRGSSFNGSYSIEISRTDDGVTVYYSTGDVDNIGIETDELGYKHIKNVELENDDRWIKVNVGETIPEDATAIATHVDSIQSMTSKGFSYSITATNNKKGDYYYFGQYVSSDNLTQNIFSTYKKVKVIDRNISGTVFEDLNRNDELNDTDAKLNDYTVELLNEEGTKIAETTTDSNGQYEFSIPGRGNYYIRISLPSGYELIPKGTTDNSNKINTTLISDVIDHTNVAHTELESIGNINVGIRKKPSTLVVKYLDKNDNHPLVEQTEETVYYTDNYETHGLTTIPENYSFLENAGAPVADVVNSDYIEVIYYYDFTPATITTKHYIDGTSNKIHEDVIQNKKLTQPYSTSVLDTTNLNYEYVRTDGDSTSGTVGKTEIVVNYYYKLKTGTVTTHHYLYDNGDTTTKLAPDVTREWNYTDTYTTSISNQVAANYEFYKKSDNYTNVMSSPSVEVNYYYRLKDSNLTTSITKTGTEEITAKDSEVNYTITYNAEVSEYIGDGIITIVDLLPYAIDIDNSDLDGGTYDANNKTITWTENWTGIDTYNNNNQKTITKNIKLVYDGIVGRDRIMTNTTTGTITLSNNSREAQTQTTTNIRINGNIKVVYVDKDTGEEIADAIEETNLVGEEFISSAIEKEGYKLVTKPDSETFEFEEEDQLITYSYEHIKFEIKGKVLGVGGKIRGDEDVYWGDDSTEGNIIVEADDGYIIEAILVNGERMDIEPGQVTLVLENFKEVLENKNIEVVFAKKPQENPNTKAFIGLIILISWLILLTNAILLKKSQELE